MAKPAICALIILAGISCTPPKEETPTRGRLELLVPESHAPLMLLEADEFHRLYPEATVFITATSTREAIVALLNGSVKMICSDRPLNEEEKSVAARAGIKLAELRIAQDALAVVVHRKNPMVSISHRSLREVLSGRKTFWDRVPESKWSGRIELVLTGRNSGAHELLTRQLFNLPTEPAPFLILETQKEILDYVESHPHAIGVVSIVTLRDSTGSARVLAVEGRDSSAHGQFIKLHQANVYRSLYPLRYPVYLFSTAGQASLATGFSSFVASAPGQKVLLNAGLVPATMPIRLVQINEK